MRSTDESGDVQRRRHVAHWGPFNALVRDGVLIGIEPFERDPHPTPLIEAFRDTIDAKSRIRAPMVRKSWLDQGPGAEQSWRFGPGRTEWPASSIIARWSHSRRTNSATDLSQLR